MRSSRARGLRTRCGPAAALFFRVGSACGLARGVRVCVFSGRSRSSPPLPAPRSVQLTMTILLAVLIMIDFMFLDDSHFIFDPSIQVRAAAAGVRTALARPASRKAYHESRLWSLSPLVPSALSLAELHAANGTITMNCSLVPAPSIALLKQLIVGVKRLWGVQRKRATQA